MADKFDELYPQEATAPGFEYDNTASLADGPVGLAKKFYHNATRGLGPAGLVSSDGTLAGGADEALGAALRAPVTAFRDMRDGTRFLKKEEQQSAKADKDPDYEVEVPDDDSDFQARADRFAAEEPLWRYGDGGVPRGPAAYWQPEGASKATVGGDDIYNEAFRGAPRRRDEAMDNLGNIQGQRAAEMAALYDRQAKLDEARAVADAARRQQEQEELQRRQEDLDKATKFHTRELQDQGKFWANPGNIIAAISYSLMPIFSNDPTVGVKLINQAIQQDIDNRARAAEAGIKEARANLDGYRQIAGDRQQGDLLARAEAHRMAGQEIARIGARFSGPEAQAQVKIMQEDQRVRAAAAEMEFYAKYVHTAPKKTDPKETDALYKGPGGWAPLGGSTGSAVNGMIGDSPTQAAQTGLRPAVKAIARTGGPEAINRLAKSGKITRNEMRDAVKLMYMQRAARRNPQNPAKEYDELVEAEAKQLAERIATMKETSAIRFLVTDAAKKMKIIELTEIGEGRDPEKFMKWAATAWPQDWYRDYKKITAKDPRFSANAAEMKERFREQKATELRAQLQDLFNHRNKELFGASQSTQGPGGGEIGRGMTVVSDKSSFSATQNFLENYGKQLQKQITDTMAGLNPMQQMLMDIRTDGGTSDTNLPMKGVRPGPSKK